MVDIPAHHPSLRAALLLGGSVLGALSVRSATTDLRHPDGAAFQPLLLAVAGWVLLACCCWAVVLSAAALVEAGSAGRLRATRWVGCPPAIRGALLTGLGVALVGLPGPAQATDHGAAPVVGPDAVRGAGLAVPVRPVGPMLPAVPAAAHHVVVRPGDTLWGLAAQQLPPTATDGQVAASTRALHRRNAAVIGPDADLIRPGQRLAVPPPSHTPHPHPAAEETP